MEGGKRKVGMLRVERREQVFEREAVLGRDAESVFPTELKAASEAEANEVTDALKQALGSVKFVTESQVEEIKAKDGSGGDGAGTSKPLAQVLSERKQQKDEAFQEQWKLIKQGKNRPLDADEIAFLESVETKKRKIEETRKAEEETEVLAFQLAREQAAARSGPRARATSAKPPAERRQRPTKSSAGCLLRVKPKVPPRETNAEEEGDEEPVKEPAAWTGLSLVGDYESDSD